MERKGRHRGRSLIARARGWVTSAVYVVQGRRFLRRCNVVGRWTRVMGGRPIVENRGYIELGQKVRLMCDFAPVELRTASGARLVVGSRTGINYGTTFEVVQSVSVGRNVDIGPHCIITDSDLGSASRPDGSEARPVVIEDGVWLASRVIVLPGSQIGAGAVVTAGSVVDGEIPPGVVAGGIPARVLRSISTDTTGSGSHAPSSQRGEESRPERAPAEPVARGLLIADFTIDPLATALARPERPIRLVADVAPFATVVPSLMAPPTTNTDFAVVWTRPDEMLPSFGRLMALDVVDERDLLADVDRFAELVRRGLSGFACVLVPTWSVPPWFRGRGLTDGRPGGIAWAVNLVNQRLMAALGEASNTFVVDVQQWLAAAGRSAYSDRLWYLGKIPFAEPVFDAAADDVIAAITAVTTAARKLVVVDLDNTLWGGVVGDDGWEALRLGGHDSVGEAFVDFQRALKQLTRRGVLLAIASKNDEDVALEAIDRHEAMVLTREDFVGWRIDWSDKAANISELVTSLNLGLQSVVFIDDNPHERARVRSALPEVLVPEWPADPTQYVRALGSLRCFDGPAVSHEDLVRTELYATERRRTELFEQIGSFDDWIRDLGVVVRAEPLGRANIARATQLLNKTNQMNLTTRRLTEAELGEWADDDGHATWCISVSDRLGDAGLTGIVSIAAEDDRVLLVDFVMSCRVMGRRIEETMLHIAVQLGQELAASTLTARLIPTSKNRPCQRLFEDASGLQQSAADTFTWDLAKAYPRPANIAVEIDRHRREPPSS